jgi:magnesium-transporting ATPase (P-type)
MGNIDVFSAWSSPAEAVAGHHGVDLEKGLSEQQIKAKRQQYGFNELEKQPGKPLWKLVLEQFDDMLVKVRLHVCHQSNQIGPPTPLNTSSCRYKVAYCL